MPRATIPPVLRAEGETIAATTTDKYFQKPVWAQEVQLVAVTESLLQIGPELKAAIKFIDATGVYSDLTASLVDRSTSTTVELDSMIFDTDYLYLFSDQKFNHFYVDVTNVNGERYHA